MIHVQNITVTKQTKFEIKGEIKKPGVWLSLIGYFSAQDGGQLFERIWE